MSTTLFAQSQNFYISTQEESLLTNWDQFNDQYPLLYKQFAYATFRDSTTLNRYDSFYAKHKEALDRKIRERYSPKRKGEIIFNYLHEVVFLRYNLFASVQDLINAQEYNCVTATAFFVTMAEAYDIPYQIYETPAHVYASIPDESKEFIVELTDPENGFDFDSKQENVLQTLLNSKLISRDELEEKGAEAVYRNYVTETNPIAKKELLAIQYFNDGIILSDQQRYIDSYLKFQKALLLYPNTSFSEGYKVVVNISQFDFTLPLEEKIELMEILLASTPEDSLLTYAMMPHFGELIEDLMKNEQYFGQAESLLNKVEDHIYKDALIEKILKQTRIYVLTGIAQNASLKGETNLAKEKIETALLLDPDNPQLQTYYVAVSSSQAVKMAQFGMVDEARELIDELATEFPNGYPVINDSRIRIILAGWVPLGITEDNASIFIPELNLARSLQAENIYLKSFAARVFHELAMQQIRRTNYQKAKDYILLGLEFNFEDATLRSDLTLINKMLK